MSTTNDLKTTSNIFDKEFLITISIWLILEIVSMVYISELFLSSTNDESFLKTARLSSTLSIVINVSLIPAYLFAIGLFSFCTANLVEFKITKRDITEALKLLMITYIIYNAFKICNAFILLADTGLLAADSDAFTSDVNQTTWHQTQQFIDVFFLLGSCLVYVFALNKQLRLSFIQGLAMLLSILLPMIFMNYTLIKAIIGSI